MRRDTLYDALLTMLEATLLPDWFRALGAFPPASATFPSSPATAAFAALAPAGRHDFD
jgi:hypothetical protein